MAKKLTHKAIRFPTGVIAYLDEKDVLKGSPAEVIAGLSHRELPEELNAFEVFLKNLIAANGKVGSPVSASEGVKE